jgi:hypothetical protein
MPRRIIALLVFFVCIALSITGCGWRSSPGEQQMTFCQPFVDKVAHKMPMPYKEFITYTGGEGQPSGLDIIPDPYRHWDGMSGNTHTSSLNALIVRKEGQDWVEGGMVTCPDNRTIQFGVWK